MGVSGMIGERAKTFYKTLGAEVRSKREAKDLKPWQLADKIGTTENFILEVEAGLRKFHCHTLDLILNVLDDYEIKS